MRDTNTENGFATNDFVIDANIISGKCAAPFWDAIYERVVSLDSVRGLQDAFAELHSAGKDVEATQMLFSLYDLIEEDYPEELDLIARDNELVGIFIGEFLADIEDLMYDYEVFEYEQ